MNVETLNTMLKLQIGNTNSLRHNSNIILHFIKVFISCIQARSTTHSRKSYESWHLAR